MASSALSTVVRHLRQTALRGHLADLSDERLLECFLDQRDELAFAALVRRHGPMVLGVCRRILRHNQDAEDAFQATFLVLARKADTVWPRELVGHFLYGVAYRTALKAKTLAARRRLRERPMSTQPFQPVPADPDRFELETLLDEAIQWLPERYRVPLVLCELEGKGRHEAAQLLRIPEGTLSSRLARARRMLARRLTARGLTLSTGVVSVGFAHQAATGAVPAALVTSTVQSALGPASLLAAPIAALAKGVMQTMLITRLKITTFLLVALATTGLGTGLLNHQALAEKPGTVQAVAVSADKPKPEVGPTIPATVHAVDTGKRTLTASVSSGPGKKEHVDKTFELGRDAKVLLAHGLKKETKEGSLADLTEGTPVFLQLSTDQKSVVRIQVQGGSLYGGVKSVDADKNTVTFVTKEKGGGTEKTLELATGAKVLLDDGLVKGGAKEGKLTDLSEGTPVIVQLSGYDQKTIVGIRAHGPTVHGQLKGVDAGANTITVTVKENATVEDKTFDLSKNVKSDSGKVTDLTAGTAVSLQLSVLDKKTVVAIHVHKSN